MVKDTITCSSCTDGRSSKRLEANSSITCIGIVPLAMCEPICMHLKAVDMLCWSLPLKLPACWTQHHNA